jgi:glycosyltransferase involved in cell wall biosynthesis
MSEKLISVLIPAYNVEKFIEASIESILRQTYRELEVIVVDDCSTDRTWDLLRKIAELDPRIILLRNSKNSKIVTTLNKALAAAKGRYIARMDGDDIAHPERIERQYRYLSENRDIALVGVNTVSIDEDGREFARQELLSDQRLIRRCLNLTSLVSHNWLCRREVYEKLGGYRELAPVEDYDFLLRMYAEGYRFTNLPFYGMKIRYRHGNTATTAGLEQIRAFNYVSRLYRQRRRTGHDDYCQDAFRTFVQAPEWQRKLHLLSAGELRRAFDARSGGRTFGSLFHGLMSIFISPYQLQTILRRRLMRFYKRIYS